MIITQDSRATQRKNDVYYTSSQDKGLKKSSELFELANLNFNVEKRHLYTTSNNGSDMIELMDKFTTVRTDTDEVLGVVGKEYEIVQNTSKFEVFDDILGVEDAYYTAAGSIGNGRKVFTQVKMPAHIRIDGTDDITESYILLLSPHDGTVSLTIKVTPIRLWCKNRLNAALRGKGTELHFKHVGGIHDKMKNVKNFLGIHNKLIEDLNLTFNQMAKTPISDAEINIFGKLLFPNDSTRTVNSMEKMFESILNGVGQTEIKDMSLWKLYNGVTTYIDSEKSNNRDTESAWIDDVAFGAGYKFKQKAFDFAYNYMNKGSFGEVVQTNDITLN
jgi:phage/plasmid-like protein (TIGR03299 family)